MKKKIVIILVVIFSLHADEPVGLKNLGNTCFQNASLQCMYNIKDLTDFLIAKKGTDYYVWKSGKNDTVAKVYIDLIETLRKSSGSFSPTAFCDRASWDILGFPKAAQADASEFVGKLISHLADDDVNPKYKKHYGYPAQASLKTHVADTISVFFEDTLRCTHCTDISARLDQATMVSVPVKKQDGTPLVTLAECFNEFTREENIDAYKCKMCGQGAKKRITLFTAPEILVVHPKRWDQAGMKLTTPITLPLQLDARPYFSVNSLQSSAAQYELIGVTIHSGDVGGGHYWAYVKTPDGKWYNANDDRVEEVSLKKIQEFETQGYIDNVLATPYVLYYKRSILLTKPAQITISDLENKLKQAGITQAELNSFLVYQMQEAGAFIAKEVLVDGVNQGLTTLDRIVADIQKYLKDLTNTLKRELIQLDVSLSALAGQHKKKTTP